MVFLCIEKDIVLVISQIIILNIEIDPEFPYPCILSIVISIVLNIWCSFTANSDPITK